MPTVREFIHQAYKLISASSPTVPLHGSDLNLGVTVLNQLLQSYAATGLLITVAKSVSVNITAGTSEIICGPSTAVPTPDITEGRLANLQSAWLLLDGVTYPLITESRNEFLAAWKFDPLQSLPRYAIVFPEIDVVRIRLYPAADQAYEFNCRGKFQLNELTSNDDMSLVPQYNHRFLLLASARDIAMYKGRMEAWTDPLEKMYQDALDNMVNSSEINVQITGEADSLLNGAHRLRAGV